MKYNAVVLSGPPGSGKSSLSEELSKRFGWEVYSVGKLWRQRWQELYPNAEIPFEDYWRLTTIGDNKSMDMKLKEIIEKGNVVADTRYGAICGECPNALLVYTMSDIETRIRRAMLTKKYPENFKAVKIILNDREADEVKMGKLNYGKDYRDPKFYHLILNTGLLTVSQEADIISSMIK